jgi:deazaflavin-dependent oxidoreductase (nitroreductase family)
MTDTNGNAFEDALIADMRAHGGAVTQGPLTGHPLLIMTSRGAKSGEPRRSILTWSRDDGDYIVAGTAGGSPIAPAWVHNVRSNAAVRIEVENRRLEAHATVVDDAAERDRLWRQHVERLPWFADYVEKVGRVIPMVRFRPGE